MLQNIGSCLKNWIFLSVPRLGSHLSVIVICFLMIFLYGCSHVRPDGPPNFYVDANRIPDATPRHEPRAKYGNPRSYRVFGKRYYPLKSSKNYNKIGVASWYGTKFHTRKTSSGEKYDMLQMTAAHKTLPLPTYVEVTNLKNKRKIIVKVNDRGPFSQNRLIDLSYVAAKKLGMIGRGTTLVRVRAIDTSRNQQFKRIYLTAGAFRHKENAMRLKMHLKTWTTLPVHVFYDKRAFYLVKIGPIKDLRTSAQLSHRLKSHGIVTRKG